MQILLVLFYSLLFIGAIYKFEFFDIPGFTKHSIVIVFIAKIIAGITVWWVYTYYYPGGDMQNYFNDGHQLFRLLMNNPQQFMDVVFNNAPFTPLKIWNSSYDYTLYNDARTMSLLNMLFHFFSFGYFHVHIVFMCFLSLIGLTALYKTFEKYLTKNHTLLFITIFFIPSVLFWSSGVLKEGLLFFGLGIFLYATNCGFPTTYNWKKVAAIIFSITILLLIKFYVFIAILPGLYLNILVSKTSERKLFLKYLSGILLICLGAFLLTLLNPDYNPLKIIKDKQVRSILEARGGVYLANKQKVVCINYNLRRKQLLFLTDTTYKIKPGSNYVFWPANDMSVQDSVRSSTDTSAYTMVYTVVPANSILTIDFLKPNLSNILQVLPQALFNVFLQPLIWQIDDTIQVFPAIENIIFVLIIIGSFFYVKKDFKYKSIVFFCLSFVFILFLLIGITSPAVGAIVRYKIHTLPFLFIALILITSKNNRKISD